MRSRTIAPMTPKMMIRRRSCPGGRTIRGRERRRAKICSGSKPKALMGSPSVQAEPQPAGSRSASLEQKPDVERVAPAADPAGNLGADLHHVWLLLALHLLDGVGDEHPGVDGRPPLAAGL